VSSIAELMGKKINGLISPMATHGAPKTTMDVVVSNNKLDRSITLNPKLITMHKVREFLLTLD
jgi:hypothetical protein